MNPLDPHMIHPEEGPQKSQVNYKITNLAEEPTIDPKTIGYPEKGNKLEMGTYQRKQIQRKKLGGTANGKLTQSEVDAILRARAKRSLRGYRA